MINKMFLFILILLSGTVFAQIPITFSVDMKVQVKEGNFNPSVDKIYIRGNFQTDVGDASDWSGTTFTTSDTEGDTVYSLTIDFPDSTDGQSYQYKFVLNDGGWESFEPPRLLEVKKPSMILPTVYFNNDDVVTIMVFNTLNFTADISSIYGTGEGHFDPDTDSLKLEGLDWVGATVEGGNRKFTEDPFMPGIFTTSIEIKGAIGDSTKWKTRAYPDSKFFNWGWEVTPDKWYSIKENGTISDIPVFVPDVFPKKPALATSVDILFQVNVVGAKNKYNNELIDPSTIEFVGLKGQNSVLGSWGGDWMPSDTTAGNLLVLNDSGVKGDKTAGDNVWSLLVTFPAGNDGGPSLYKYGIAYPGSDTLNGSFHPLDNELQGGFDHYVNIMEGPTIEIYNQFGSMIVTGVEKIDNNIPSKFSLEQNYPNPFNPVTKIRYSVSVQDVVTLKIYNLLGQQVAELINAEQNTGTYEISFDASGLSSGLYFYTLSTGNFTSTKKMMVLK